MQWMWVSVMVRSALILLGAEILRRIPRLSPGHRHRVLLAAFVLLMVWPLCSASLPAIHVPLWGALGVEGNVTIQQTMLSGRASGRPSGPLSWPFAIWVAGVLVTLAPVAIGYFDVLRLAAGAKPLHEAFAKRLLGELCVRLGMKTPPEVLVLSKPMMPMTFGLRRVRILLPAECMGWTQIRWRAVLLHELAHIERRDLFSQLFANGMAALWWFQPLCWISRWNLRRESERACDAVVVASGLRASDYAHELLEIARSYRAGGCCSSAAFAMARPAELEGRLCAILEPHATGRTKRLSAAAIAVLVLLTLGASAVTLAPEQSTTSKGDPMRHTLLSGLLVSAGLSVTGLGAPGQQQPLSKGETAAYGQSSNPKRIRVGGEKAQANLIYKVQPVYPAAAKAAGVQGTVELDVVISAEGVPEDIKVVRSPSDELSQSAVDAVTQWRYRPMLLNGQPIEIETDVIVNYTLSK